MEKTGTPIGSYAPDFELPGTDGKVHHLARYLEQYQAIAVVILSNSCPYVQLYLERLKQIQAEFQPQGVMLVGVNANDDRQSPEDSFEQMKAFATAHQLNFPYLRDVTQDVTHSFGAERTPDTFLIDQSGVLRYTGAIDDNPHAPAAVQTAYLRDAIVHLLRGAKITVPATRAIGSSIKWRT